MDTLNSSVAIILSAATANLVTAAIHAAISRAPGWKIARVISIIAFTGGLYNVLSALTSLNAMSSSGVLLAGRLMHVTATLHCVGWVVYAFGGPEGSIRGMPRSVRYAIGVVLAIGGVLAITNSVLEPQITVVDFESATVTTCIPS